jgi:hypothetical protein
MTTETDVFRFNGKRYAVSYAEIKINDYDPGYRQLQIGTYTPDQSYPRRLAPTFKKTYKKIVNNKTTSKAYATGRKAILVVVRAAWTGTPYTGIAIVSPNDKKISGTDKVVARRLAAKRAIFSMGHQVYDDLSEDMKSTMMAFGLYRNDFIASMWSAYRKMLHDRTTSNNLLSELAVEKLNGTAPKNGFKLPADPIYQNA